MRKKERIGRRGGENRTKIFCPREERSSKESEECRFYFFLFFFFFFVIVTNCVIVKTRSL